MKDQIKITGITAVGHHGVFDYERENGQRFTADITLFFSFAKAAKSDDLADTVDYGQIAEIAHELLLGVPVNLIEALADQMAREILALGKIDAVEVTIHKPNAPINVPFDDVTATVYRAIEGAGN